MRPIHFQLYFNLISDSNTLFSVFDYSKKLKSGTHVAAFSRVVLGGIQNMAGRIANIESPRKNPPSSTVVHSRVNDKATRSLHNRKKTTVQ